MKRDAVDYFDGFAELFEIAVRMNKAENIAAEVSELARRSAELRSGLYKALVNEFLPPIERSDIFDMINGLHELNLAQAELKIVSAYHTDGKYGKKSTEMLIMTGKTIKELRNFKKSANLTERVNNIHREYASFICELAAAKHEDTDRDHLSGGNDMRVKAKGFCRACERVACLAEQIIANNV